MPEQIFLDSEVCDFANLASGYRQYPLPRTAICRSVRRAKLIVTASHVSEGHHESERNGGFRPHPLCSNKPRRRRAAEQRDEVAPFHWPDASRAFDRKDSTPQYGRRLLRCGISIQPMSQMGQGRSFGDVCSMSELPSKAEVDPRSCDVAKVPQGDICSAASLGSIWV
jgi:hypothetical protein